jgi:hypothetical protein
MTLLVNPLAFALLDEQQCERLGHDAAALLPSKVGTVYSGLGRIGGPVVNEARYKAIESHIELKPPFDWLAAPLRAALERALAHFAYPGLVIGECPRVLTYAGGGTSLGTSTRRPTSCVPGQRARSLVRSSCRPTTTTKGVTSCSQPIRASSRVRRSEATS